VQSAYGGEQVGPESQVGSATALEYGEHLGEGVRDEVIDIAVTDELAREPARSLDMALEQLAVGGHVTTPDGRNELSVARSVDALKGAQIEFNGPIGGRCRQFSRAAGFWRSKKDIRSRVMALPFARFTVEATDQVDLADRLEQHRGNLCDTNESHCHGGS
jgi:hypothetical protein